MAISQDLISKFNWDPIIVSSNIYYPTIHYILKSPPREKLIVWHDGGVFNPELESLSVRSFCESSIPCLCGF